MAYIRATGHTISFVLEIAEDGHTQVYANVLHGHFENKVYRLFDPTKREIVLSRNVVFDKNRIGYHYILENSTTYDDFFSLLESTLSHNPSHHHSGNNTDQIGLEDSIILNLETIINDPIFPTFIDLPSHDEPGSPTSSSIRA
jgi:hypothetical protein